MEITPHIVVQGAERAAAFYRDAFGAEELSRIPTPDGRLMSVQLRLGGSRMGIEVQVSLQLGFWLCVAALLAAIALDGLMLRGAMRPRAATPLGP